MSKKILMIEDERGLRLTLSDRLRSEGYEVDTAADGLEGEAKAVQSSADVILLDVMLPGKGGFDVCRDLRQQGITTPILMLTARGQTIDKVLGLKIGADDYLTKPFETMELLARVEALLRRNSSPAASPSAAYSFGDVQVDVRRTEVRKGGTELSLSAKEFQLLKYFLEHRGNTLSREVLLHEVWDYDSTPTTRTVDVHVAWLRQKLEENAKQPRWILTVHGMGYKFAE
jgi:two-component system, OmpR family, alkaline phosphatase synthesis response regulator PhoP